MQNAYVGNKQESTLRVTASAAADMAEVRARLSTVVYQGSEPFLRPSTQVSKGKCGAEENGFRGPSSPACASVPHSYEFCTSLLTLAALVCGGIPDRTGTQPVPCSPDKSPSQVRVRPLEGCGILHFYATGGRLSFFLNNWRGLLGATCYCCS